MTQRLEIYKCNLCGNIVEVLHEGAGQLVCCGQPMECMTENTVDAAKEKQIHECSWWALAATTSLLALLLPQVHRMIHHPAASKFRFAATKMQFLKSTNLFCQSCQVHVSCGGFELSFSSACVGANTVSDCLVGGARTRNTVVE